MRSIIVSIFLVQLLALQAEGTNYYVSPSGDDDNNGLDSTIAWLSIDNGDQKGLLGPGDTVNILPGTYFPASSIQLKTNASGELPIVYRKYGAGSAVIDANDQSNRILLVEGNHAFVEGLEFTNTQEHAIELKADSCTIKQCSIYDIDDIGITVTGSYNLMLRNVIANTGGDGIENNGDYNNTYHNTVYYSGGRGIHYKAGVSTGRIFNNISVGNNEGIRGDSEVICGFNLLWLNTSNYTNGIVDSAGGIVADPLFIDPASDDFSLQANSPAVDSGLDIGYSYNGNAPDMGALEFFNQPPELAPIGPQSVEEGQNLNFIISASDPDGTTPALTAEDVPTNATFVDNGDGTGTFDFNPGYSQEGLYNVTFIASDGELADSEAVAITVTPAPVTYIDVSPPSNVVVELTSVQYAAYGYDAGSAFVKDLTDSVVWSTTDPAGSVTLSGLYTAGDQLSPPDYYVKAIYQGSMSDSGQATVISNETLDYIRIEWLDGTPFDDTTLTTDDDTTTLCCRGYDSGDSLLGNVSVNWSVIGEDAIGSTSPSGGTSTTLELFKPGSGWVVVFKGPTLSDTTGVITCLAGAPSQIAIEPDTATVGIGDTIQFIAVGWDADLNPVGTGDLEWGVIGRIGSIDASGLFVASAPGVCSVAVVSSINNVTATSGAIGVESLYLTPIPIGITFVHPGRESSSILAFRIDNYFDSDKAITDVTLRDASRGTGSSAEKLTNIDSISLWVDLDDDSILTASDSLIMAVDVASEVNTLSFSPLTIASETGRTFLVSAKASRFPHDGDSLDVFLLPATDILTSDTTTIDAPDTLNSFGYCIIDGLVADQISLVNTGLVLVSPADTVYNVLTLDIPRNGYREDTLQFFSVVNMGTASAGSIDSLFLYSDDGNGTWGGTGEETLLGELVFTGSRWIRSGLAVSLTEPTTRFYIGAKLSGYPMNGATLSLTVPRNGIEMFSDNDGPIDSSLQPVDTIEIQSTEAVSVNVVSVPSLVLIPGEYSNPLTGIELTNGYITSVAVDSISVSIFAVDPDGASQEQLDSQVDSFLIYLDRDGDYTTLGLSDTLLAVAPVIDGVATLKTGGLILPGEGGSVGLSIVTLMDLRNSKNENLINVGLAAPTAINFGTPVTVAGSFPLKNESDHSIDAFPAAAVLVNTAEGTTLYGAQTGQLVFDFELPRNGYSSDQLRSLRLINTGTLHDVSVLQCVHVYIDATGNGYSQDDYLLGDMVHNSISWNLTNLSHPLIDSTTRFLVVVDITSEQFEGGTLQFEIPTGGIRYWSGTVGPDDAAVGNHEAHLVFPSNRVTAISIPASSQTVTPGSLDNIILTYALYNGYVGQVQSLQAITLTNISRSMSGQSFSDHELGQISLYIDSDNNRTFDNDSMVAGGYFSDGWLRLSGLDIQLPPESLSYFFVAVDVSLDGIDADSLAVSLANPSDFTFSEPVIINGDLPLISGGYYVIDGSVSGQYDLLQVAAGTLRPGDTSITLFAFRPAANGDLTDTLESVVIANLKDATSSDIASLEIWLDANGDSTWQSTDSLLGPCSYSGGVWNIGALDLEVTSSARPILFAVADIDLLAAPGAAFQGTIPLSGCQYASANDGPIDAPLTNANVLTVSNSGLRISNSPLNGTFSVGQTIEVRFSATNLLSQPMDSVTGYVVDIENPLSVSLDSCTAGPINLAGGESTDFVFYYTAAQPGEVSWQLRAIAPTLPDSSAVTQTSRITVQATPGNVSAQLINSIPTAVTKGQTNVFPLSLRFCHPDTLSTVASLRLDSLIVSIEDGSESPLVASEAFNRIALMSDYTILAVVENVPDQSSISMVFNEPVIVSPGEKQIFSLVVDIDTFATASSFAIALMDANSIPMVNENDLQPVTIDPSVVFPLRTESCRIDEPSREAAVSYISLLGEIVNYGQEDVNILQLNLRHPGPTGSSQIQLTGLSFQFLDDSDSAINAGDLFDQIQVVRQQTVIGQVTGNAIDTTMVAMQLGSPLTLNAGEQDSVRIVATIKQESALTGFSLLIADSTHLVIRDLGSGSLLAAATDTLVLSTGTTFPISTGRASLRQAASALGICARSLLPTSIVGGADSLALIEYSLHYNMSESYSSVRVNGALLHVLDSLGRPLDPDRLFDRVGYRATGGPTSYQPFIRLLNGAVVITFGDTGLLIDPGDSLVLDLVADIEADAPFDHFVLRAGADDALSLADAADSTHNPGFSPDLDCNIEFPFITGITQIFLPAGRPTVQSQTLSARIAFPGQTGLTIFDGNLIYESPGLQGDLSINTVRGQILRRTTTGLTAISGSEVLDAVHLYLDHQLVAGDTSLTNDSIVLSLESEFVMSTGSSLPIALKCDIRADAAPGNYVIRFADSSFIDISDRNLLNVIYPIVAGRGYPLLTAEISVSAAGLENSFTNYPNPFNPARGEETTIGYILAEDAHIDIEMFSITGKAVKDIAKNAFREAGSHNEDTWFGLNEIGREVIPGTYFCRITARYTSGKVESFRRKVAVIR